jgi:hypothetical protein
MSPIEQSATEQIPIVLFASVSAAGPLWLTMAGSEGAVIKTLLLTAPMAVAFATGASAQSPKTCVYQYADAKGITPASLIAGGFDIKAGWAGGLWLQKGKETYFCNTGRVPDNQAVCWTLREPLPGQSCE